MTFADILLTALATASILTIFGLVGVWLFPLLREHARDAYDSRFRAAYRAEKERSGHA